MDGDPAAEVMPLTPEELAKLVAEYHDQVDAGHTRLRTDFRELHDRMEMAMAIQRGRIDLLDNQFKNQPPPDVTKLRFSTGVVVSLLLFTASLVGAAYGFSALVSGKIDALAKQIDSRDVTYQRSIDGLTRNMELLKYEQQRLREDVTKGQVK